MKFANQCNVRLQDETLAIVKKIAEKEGNTVSAVLRRLIAKGLKQEARR